MLKSGQCHTTGRSVRSRRQFEPQAQRRRQTGGANPGGTPCWQKSSCSDSKRQRERPRKRPTARGLSRSHCRLRRRPRSQPNSKENAPTRHARATGRDLSQRRQPQNGRHDHLTNAAAWPPVRCSPIHRAKESPKRARGFQELTMKGIQGSRCPRRSDTISVTQGAELLSRYGSDAPRPVTARGPGRICAGLVGRRK